jgi:hypothetical protein
MILHYVCRSPIFCCLYVSQYAPRHVTCACARARACVHTPVVNAQLTHLVSTGGALEFDDCACDVQGRYHTHASLTSEEEKEEERRTHATHAKHMGSTLPRSPHTQHTQRNAVDDHWRSLSHTHTLSLAQHAP